jgi:hypothetical protein
MDVIYTPTAITLVLEAAADIVNGIATAEISPEAIAAALGADGIVTAIVPVEIQLTVPNLTPDVVEASINLTTESIAELAARSNVSVLVNLEHLGTITLPNAALRSIAQAGGSNVEIGISVVNNQANVVIAVDNNPLTNVAGGVFVAIPGVAEYSGSHVVAFLYIPGQQPQVIRKSVVENNIVNAVLNGTAQIITASNFVPFADVNAADWFSNAVQFVAARKIFRGVGNDQFAPQEQMTRAMFATVLHNLANNPSETVSTAFTDVEAGQWYTDGIAWAASVGLVTGYGDGTFGAHDDITREQVAVIMLRYAQLMGVDTTARGNLGQFPDSGHVSPWAIDALSWAVGTGLMQGDGTNMNPQSTATRAEIATIVQNFVTYLVR